MRTPLRELPLHFPVLGLPIFAVDHYMRPSVDIRRTISLGTNGENTPVMLSEDALPDRLEVRREQCDTPARCGAGMKR